MHLGAGMDTRKIEEGSRLVGATSWGAIASGVFVALALQTVLLLFGLGISGSVGDHIPGGGYSAWAVLVGIISMGIGAALAAAISKAEGRKGGIAAGLMTWAVALALGGLLGRFGVESRLASAWWPFLAAILGFAAAGVGGWFGASIGKGAGTAARPPITRTPIDTGDMAAHPVH